MATSTLDLTQMMPKPPQVPYKERVTKWAILLMWLLYSCPNSVHSQPQQQQQRQQQTCDVAEYDDSSAENACQSSSPTNPLRKCKLVVTESTIEGAGLGIFTSIQIKDRDLIGYGDMVIPLPRIASTLPDPLEDYSWNGRVYSGPLNAFAPGLQSLMNSHMALLNVHQVKPATNVFADSVDATPYHYLQTIAENDIPAGGELFTFYGDHWFQGREGRFQAMPMSDEFPLAENVTIAFEKLSSVSHNHVQWQADLWQLVKAFPFQSRIVRALPEYQDVQQVVQLGLRSLFQPQATRDIETELMDESKSRCLDMIRQGPSSVHALGAFATRDILEGTVITGSPLLQTSKERWDERGQVWDAFTKSYKKSNTGTASYALLVNYCWGHVQSSLLLCPYGVGVTYINHANNQKPNVRVRWAPDGQISHNVSSLSVAPKDLWSTMVAKVSLALDYVAIRDIQDGEELLIDYGSAWELAYQEHLSMVPLDRLSASDWNVRTRDNLLFTEAEQAVQPYPDHLEFKCHPLVMSQEQTRFDDTSLWTSSPNIIKDALDCQILERQDNTQNPQYTTYIVRVFYQDTWRGRAGIPRAYIRFFDKKDHQQQKIPFRHEMQLPEDMIPDIWRDFK